ncbi:MAG: cytidylate kinase family protein [Magnetococcales bacterium]|nr:cytidylate kinase family protein [Magnetococcales bacterium]
MSATTLRSRSVARRQPEIYTLSGCVGGRNASPPLVTLSGMPGTNCRQVGLSLAAMLGVSVHEPEALLAVSLEEKEQSRGKEDSKAGRLEKWVRVLLPGFADGKHRGWERYLPLVKAVLDVVPTGGVILGEGCHLILGSQKVFRVRVEASEGFCARRVAQADGVALDEALVLVREAAERRERLLRQLRDHFPTERACHDLIFSAERYAPEQMARLAKRAMETGGFGV